MDVQIQPSLPQSRFYIFFILLLYLSCLSYARIQNTILIAIWKNCSNTKIAFHNAAKMQFDKLKTFSMQRFHRESTTFLIHAPTNKVKIN